MPAQELSTVDTNLPDWLDPFPEPRTLPNGWDLDSIFPHFDPTAVEGTDAPVEDPHR